MEAEAEANNNMAEAARLLDPPATIVNDHEKYLWMWSASKGEAIDLAQDAMKVMRGPGPKQKLTAWGKANGVSGLNLLYYR